jgi:hypothetical protein
VCLGYTCSGCVCRVGVWLWVSVFVVGRFWSLSLVVTALTCLKGCDTVGSVILEVCLVLQGCRYSMLMW